MSRLLTDKQIIALGEAIIRDPDVALRLIDGLRRASAPARKARAIKDAQARYDDMMRKRGLEPRPLSRKAKRKL